MSTSVENISPSIFLTLSGIVNSDKFVYSNTLSPITSTPFSKITLLRLSHFPNAK